jgi:hypothetical protein
VCGLRAGVLGTHDPGSSQAYAANSDNNAVSFTGRTTLGAKAGLTSASNVANDLFYPQRRVYIQASSTAGDSRVTAVWENNPNQTDNIVQSIKSGSIWSVPVTIATGATRPSVSWSTDGTVLYGEYRNPKLDRSALYYGLAQSNGPASRSLDVLQSPLSASSELNGLAPANEGPGTTGRFGDYEGIAEANGTGWGAWTDNSGGSQTIALGHTP